MYNCEKINDPSGITGKVTGHSDCKNFKISTGTVTPDTLSCVTWTFDTTSGTLNLSHLNAAFNCCPGKLSCKVKSDNDTVRVEEKEQKQDCDCDCLFDLEIEVKGLDRKPFWVDFLEPYSGNQEKIFFEVDPFKGTEGMFCVTRMQYPWGIP
jgi:hypothetical protein